MTEAELDEYEKQVINSLSLRAKAMVPMAAPSTIPEPSAVVHSAQRTSQPNRSALGPTKLLPKSCSTLTTATTMESASRATKTKVSLTESERRRKLARINRLIKKKNLLAQKTQHLVTAPRAPLSPPPSTRYAPAPTMFPFFPKHAQPLAQPACVVTQPAYASLDLSTDVAPPPPPLIAVPIAESPLDFAAKLATLNLSFEMASLSVANGVELVLHVYASLFEKQYSSTIEDRMLYASNMFAMRHMAEEIGVKAQAFTFAHWHQIARTLINQISTLV